MSRAACWQWVKQIVLWLGLILCGYAMWRTRSLTGEAILRVSVQTWILVAVLMLIIWWLAATAWRQYLLAYTGQLPHLRTALRQLGLLLVGKYVPGGVFGFLVRLYDQPSVPRTRLIWAGLAEQAVGIAMPVALGGVLYLAAWQKQFAWMGLAFLLPPMAVLGVLALHRLSGVMPWMRRYVDESVTPSRPKLLAATMSQLGMQVVWVALIAVLTGPLLGLEGYAVLGLAGAFWLAVAVGMLVVMAPGGIGVREVALTGLASPWLDMDQAIFVSALLRMLSTLLDLSAGAVAVYLGRENNMRSGVE